MSQNIGRNLSNSSYKKYADLAFEYHIAAMQLWISITESPYLYNPIMYLFRHTIELLLKGIVIRYCDNENKSCVYHNGKRIPLNTTHSVVDLWAQYLSYGQGGQQNLFQNEEIKKTNKVISWIEDSDCNSTNYRYPYRRNGSSLNLEPIRISKTVRIPPDKGTIPVMIVGEGEDTGIVTEGANLIDWGYQIIDAIEFLFETIEQ